MFPDADSLIDIHPNVVSIQDEPPSLDREGGRFKYSKGFKEIIRSCLTKDPTRRYVIYSAMQHGNVQDLCVYRPTAESLLQNAFFKSSKKKSYLVGALLSEPRQISDCTTGFIILTDGLPPLVDRQERREFDLVDCLPPLSYLRDCRANPIGSLAHIDDLMGLLAGGYGFSI